MIRPVTTAERVSWAQTTTLLVLVDCNFLFCNKNKPQLWNEKKNETHSPARPSNIDDRFLSKK